MTTKKRAPKAAFVITVVATAALSLASEGCGVNRGTTNPPDPRCDFDCEPPPPEPCPSLPPSWGEPCFGVGLTCSYENGLCGDTEFTCSDPGGSDVSGEWFESGPSCNPPPPPGECPASVPQQGQYCDGWDLYCTYYDDCGGATYATCYAGTWEVEVEEFECNPPPPECPPELPAEGAPCDWLGSQCLYDVATGCGLQSAIAECQDSTFHVTLPTCGPEGCANLADPGACASDPSCQWLVPGCGEPPLETEGCYPAAECASDADCPAQTFCQSVIVNPCWDSSCDACGAAVSVCLPPT